MKVLILARGYPTEKYKMNGIFEFDQAKALAEAGHNVIYAALDMRSFVRWRKWGVDSFEESGVRIEILNIPLGRSYRKLNILVDCIFKKFYKKICNSHGEPDLIHAHFISNGYIATRTLSGGDIPIVLTEHFSGMNRVNLNSYLNKLGKYTYKRVNKLIAVSSALSKKIEENFDIKSEVVPNIVDINLFEYLPSNKNDNEFTFISTGSLTLNKRMDLLIDAFYEAFNNKEQVYLYIFGEGVEHDKLEQLISNYNMKEQIFLMGLAKRETIAKKMIESKCFVLVSKSETFGVAYAEAMSMGLPIISTKCGGPEDFINNENGILVSVDKKEELVKALLDIYKDVDKYNNREIAESAKNKFSATTVANRLTQIYLELVDKD